MTWRIRGNYLSKVENSLSKKFRRNLGITKPKNCVADIKGLKLASSLKSDVLQISKTAEEFIPLKTKKEIQQYAKREFGIKVFNMSDTNMANYILSGFYDIKKVTNSKLGIKKVIGKDFIKDESWRPGSGISEIGGTMTLDGKILTVSENVIKKTIAERITFLAMKEPQNIKMYTDMMLKFDKGELNYIEVISRLKKYYGDLGNVQEIPNQIVLHEIFHKLHRKSSKNFKKMCKLEELEQWNIKDKNITTEFLSPDIQKIISEWKFIGDYAKTSPVEFVAEVGSALVSGIKPPKKIMELYYKYEGPLINNI